ncbi:MAG: gamma-glutamylcyclotransferase [Verrucomicrobia bacterium]|nr:gamma-glutamylcyclotransferase [Verrucomicrobiota bacterium]
MPEGLSPSPPYFAYGSNMVLEAMRERCPTARALAPAMLRDWRYRINNRGYATVVPEAGGIVHGRLWEIDSAAEAALDAYEALDEGMYRKTRLTVVQSGRPLTAMVYLATGSDPGWPIPGYQEEIVGAAASLGVPDAYLEELQRWLRHR